ncbi:hypothetical protein GO755_04630 [Spirosoma sp. HMF4905]|uniref:DUF4760 domain-containing protein n=1 Tax=Spirosoma arboris TaxID=2682092 RepID=A0A7K1S6U5_9BACT|nr:hypothetical protein [Spirosoma arboris]MVM29308.1 hypothetical protein [Spirosoma arboris]
MKKEIADNIALFISFFSLICAAISGYYAHVAGRLSKGSIAYNFFLRYSDDKMRQSLRKVGKFKRERDSRDRYKNEFIDVWFSALKNEEGWALELEEARHIIKFYYRDVATLYQAGCIDDEIAEQICSAGGIFLFTDCILLLERRANPFPYKDEYFPIPMIASRMRKQRAEYKHKV